MLKIQRLLYAKSYQKSEQPLISVYIPTYNRPQMLKERSIPSVLQQTYSNFELIIIGDACEPTTAQVIQEFNDPRIRYINLTKRGKRYPDTPENHWLAGPVTAANRALRAVRGEWIARIDDDDIWHADHLESLLNFAQKNDFEFVSANISTTRNGVTAVAPVYGALSAYYRQVELPNGPGVPLGGTQTWLYRSYLSFFKYNINCWRKAWNKVNDIDLSLRMYDAGVRFGFLDKVTAVILPRPNETTIGIEAYLANKEQIATHFSFNA
jgi:glycosyltransferase involved in cell wall biosynthesis